MRSDNDEWTDREDEARFWAEYNARRSARGGRCGIIVVLLLGLIVTGGWWL